MLGARRNFQRTLKANNDEKITCANPRFSGNQRDWPSLAKERYNSVRTYSYPLKCFRNTQNTKYWLEFKVKYALHCFCPLCVWFLLNIPQRWITSKHHQGTENYKLMLDNICKIFVFWIFRYWFRHNHILLISSFIQWVTAMRTISPTNSDDFWISTNKFLKLN